MTLNYKEKNVLMHISMPCGSKQSLTEKEESPSSFIGLRVRPWSIGERRRLCCYKFNLLDQGF